MVSARDGLLHKIYRAWCRRRGIGVRACVKSGRGTTAHFVNRRDGVQMFKLGP